MRLATRRSLLRFPASSGQFWQDFHPLSYMVRRGGRVCIHGGFSSDGVSALIFFFLYWFHIWGLMSGYISKETGLSGVLTPLFPICLSLHRGKDRTPRATQEWSYYQERFTLAFFFCSFPCSIILPEDRERDTSALYTEDIRWKKTVVALNGIITSTNASGTEVCSPAARLSATALLLGSTIASWHACIYFTTAQETVETAACIVLYPVSE